MITTKKLLGTLALASTILFTSCEKEFDTPPIKELPSGSVITIADLRNMWVTQDVKITDELSVYGVITMDETSGNIYKEAYIHDVTGGIDLRLMSSGGLYEGDSVRVYLKGTIVSKYNQMLQLDSVDVDNNVIKQSTEQFRSPELLSDIAQITATHQAQLIQLNNVQFSSADIGQTYADAQNQQSQNRMLEDANGNQIIVRTSGYANFAGDTVPSGNGTFIGVVSQYNNDLQLLIRRPSELSLNGERNVIKDFEDQSITSGGWTVQTPVGSAPYEWHVASFNNNYYANMSNWTGSSNLASETWLISPSYDFSNSTMPTLQFTSAYKYNGPTMEVLISTNYDGVSAPSTASWSQLSPILSPGNFTWTSSGAVDLSAYTQSSVYIAFKYTGTNSDGSTWEVDDINIKE